MSTNFSFWEDDWMGNVALRDKYNRLFSYLLNKILSLSKWVVLMKRGGNGSFLE